MTPLIHLFRRLLNLAALGTFLSFAVAAPFMPAAETRAADAGAAMPYGHGVLWRIERAGMAPSHLFGTIHITDARILDLPAPVRTAFEQAHSATFEILMTDEVRLKMARAMVLDDGRTLDAILGPDLFARVVEAGRRYGLQAAQLRRFKPWALATVFSIPQAEMARTAAGAQPLDQWLQSEARRRGTPLYALENAEEQIAIFDGMAEKDQIALLAAAVNDNEQIETVFETMTKHYLARDIAAIYAMMTGPGNTMSPELTALFLRRINETRNRTMVRRMSARLAEGGAFIAIGALHLPGEKGLLSLLARAGYRVSRVY
ncbi:MAG: TraB/GumN family protein [Alphaproteobacteria bacterium]|nr:MAG: TraB/GumN family protein [Alphaproteobacteria bacterium]